MSHSVETSNFEKAHYSKTNQTGDREILETLRENKKTSKRWTGEGAEWTAHRACAGGKMVELRPQQHNLNGQQELVSPWKRY